MQKALNVYVLKVYAGSEAEFPNSLQGLDALHTLDILSCPVIPRQLRDLTNLTKIELQRVDGSTENEEVGKNFWHAEIRAFHMPLDMPSQVWTLLAHHLFARISSGSQGVHWSRAPEVFFLVCLHLQVADSNSRDTMCALSFCTQSSCVVCKRKTLCMQKANKAYIAWSHYCITHTSAGKNRLVYMQALGGILNDCQPLRCSEFGRLPQCLVDHYGLHHLYIRDGELKSIPNGQYLESLRSLNLANSTPDDIEDHVFSAPNLEVVHYEDGHHSKFLIQDISLPASSAVSTETSQIAVSSMKGTPGVLPGLVLLCNAALTISLAHWQHLRSQCLTVWVDSEIAQKHWVGVWAFATRLESLVVRLWRVM